jgi:hypothetical protein
MVEDYSLVSLALLKAGMIAASVIVEQQRRRGEIDHRATS